MAIPAVVSDGRVYLSRDSVVEALDALAINLEAASLMPHNEEIRGTLEAQAGMLRAAIIPSLLEIHP